MFKVTLIIILLCLFVSPESYAKNNDHHSKLLSKTAEMAVLKNFWDRAMKIPGINTGPANSKKRLVIVFDANCPMCARQWAILRPYLSVLRIHWVPIAFIAPSSARIGGALLGAHHPAAALAYNENHYDFTTQTGGYLAPEHVPRKYLNEVKSNTYKLLLSKEVMGTPAIGLELVPGKKYFFIPGVINAHRLAGIIPLLGR